MASASVCITNLADDGTWTASTAEADLPVSNLQNEHVGKRWRSTAEPGSAICDLLSHVSFDTLMLAGMTAGATSSVRVRVSTDNDEYTKVLLHMDGTDASTTFTDSNAGGSAHTWTAAGNAQIDTADSKFGGASGLFDGTGDYISTPDHADFALGSSDFTIDGWFKCTASSAVGGRLIALQTDFSAANHSFSIFLNASLVIQAQVSNGSALTTITGTTQFSNVLNTGWHHVALVRSGNVVKLFIDGVQEGGDAAFSGTIPNSSAVLYVSFPGTNAWQGWIDEFRLSVGIARWTTTFTPPVAAADGTGAAGDLYDATFDASDPEFDPDYGMLVDPLATPLTGRFVRFDITDTPASYVEAGIGFVGLREAFTYNFVPGGSIIWTDRSRKTKSAGGQTLIFRDNKFRTTKLNFDWIPAEQRNGVWETMARVNGNSIPVLLIIDTDSDNLPRDSIFGLVTDSIGAAFTAIADIYTAPLTVEERL